MNRFCLLFINFYNNTYLTYLQLHYNKKMSELFLIASGAKQN